MASVYCVKQTIRARYFDSQPWKAQVALTDDACMLNVSDESGRLWMQ
jgi:hypothetical protein